MLDGIVDPLANDLTLLMGLGTAVLMVAVAMFDMHQFGHIHNPVAVAFFLIGSI